VVEYRLFTTSCSFHKSNLDSNDDRCSDFDKLLDGYIYLYTGYSVHIPCHSLDSIWATILAKKIYMENILLNQITVRFLPLLIFILLLLDYYQILWLPRTKGTH